MYYTNSMKVTLKNEKTAAAALENLKVRLHDGFGFDKNYKRNPSMLMHDRMKVVENTIVLPEDTGCYLPEDAEKAIPELMQYLAEHLRTETFTFSTCNSSEYDESWVNGSYANGELKIKSTYLPSGFCPFVCLECEEVIATMTDDEEGNIHIEGEASICPECGEEIDMSDWLPVISETTIKVA